MCDEERSQPRTFDVDTLDVLAQILRAGAQLTCRPDGFFLLEGPGQKSGAGGKTIAIAVAGYVDTILNDNVLAKQKRLEG